MRIFKTANKQEDLTWKKKKKVGKLIFRPQLLILTNSVNLGRSEIHSRTVVNRSELKKSKRIKLWKIKTKRKIVKTSGWNEQARRKKNHEKVTTNRYY